MKALCLRAPGLRAANHGHTWAIGVSHSPPGCSSVREATRHSRSCPGRRPADPIGHTSFNILATSVRLLGVLG